MSFSLQSLNGVSEEVFCEYLSGVFEHSPWVVKEALAWRPFLSIQAMQAAFEAIIYGAENEKQRALIEAHPDLAAKLDDLPQLTDFSQAEQSRAGFGSLSPEELTVLREKLAAYRKKFSHPFILCVTEHPARDVLPILSVRLQATAAAEHAASLYQVGRIGWYRLHQLVS